MIGMVLESESEAVSRGGGVQCTKFLSKKSITDAVFCGENHFAVSLFRRTSRISRPLTSCIAMTSLLAVHDNSAQRIESVIIIIPTVVLQ